MELGTLVRDRRERARLGQAQLAEIIGVSPSWVSDIELGRYES